jgi:hypothetical protein
LNRSDETVGLPTGTTLTPGVRSTLDARLIGTPWAMSTRPACSSATRVDGSEMKRNTTRSTCGGPLK